MMNLLSVIKPNKKITAIYDYLVELLKEKRLYDDSLEIQILNVSVQIMQFVKIANSLATEKAIIDNDVRGGGTSRKKNPLGYDLVQLSESLRKNLRELGLSLESKVKSATANDPLASMLSEMNAIDND